MFAWIMHYAFFPQYRRIVRQLERIKDFVVLSRLLVSFSNKKGILKLFFLFYYYFVISILDIDELKVCKCWTSKQDWVLHSKLLNLKWMVKLKTLLLCPIGHQLEDIMNHLQTIMHHLFWRPLTLHLVKHLSPLLCIYWLLQGTQRRAFSISFYFLLRVKNTVQTASHNIPQTVDRPHHSWTCNTDPLQKTADFLLRI